MKRKTIFSIYTIIIGLLFVFSNSCEKDDPKSMAQLTTTVVSEITQTSAISGGNITNDGGAAVSARGICWSTNQSPTINDSKTTNGTGTGSFTANITSLTAGTTYHVRAYATNSEGTSYGNAISFTTLEATDLPTITTSEATDVSEVTQTSAVFAGNITNDGGASITARGVCWATNETPTIDDNKTVDGTGKGNFKSNITGLAPGTTYYARVYATNSKGTNYGKVISFKTLDAIDKPTITTTEDNDITEVTQTTAVFTGEITDDGGAAITARGVCWGTNETPTIDDNKTVNGEGTGSFTSNITGLAPSTTYYVRIYATNSEGTNYGNTISFTTQQGAIMGTFTDARDGNVYQTVTIGDQVWMAENLKYLPEVAGPDIGSETEAVYYVYDYNGTNVSAAKATTNYNAYGVLYNWPAAMAGAVSSSSSPSNVQGICPTGWHLPSNSEWTILAQHIGGRNVAGGKLRETGTAHWLSPNEGATNETGFTALPGGRRSFNAVFDNFSYYGYWWSATEYEDDYSWFLDIYYEGTKMGNGSHGNHLGFSVRCVKSNKAATLPTITTTEITEVAETTAVSGGRIINDGGAAVTARGVCWSINQTPSINDNKTMSGSGTGSFSSSITGLAPGTNYYVRAYATNSVGTSYGSAISFTTKQDFATITDIEENVYKIVTIGTQTWMAENLRTTKFNNGTNITLVSDSASWGQLTTPAYCWWGNDKDTFGADYGALYNWHTVKSGKLCPAGWHVPSDAEWTTLADQMGGEWVAGSKLKETGFTHWLSPNTGATNEVGFTARAGGLRLEDGRYMWLKTSANWWATDEYDYPYKAKCRQIYYFGASSNSLSTDDRYKETGLSIRCVKD